MNFLTITTIDQLSKELTKIRSKMIDVILLVDKMKAPQDEIERTWMNELRRQSVFIGTELDAITERLSIQTKKYEEMTAHEESHN